MRAALLASAMAPIAVFALTGCAGSQDPQLRVSAAASLQRAFRLYAAQLHRAAVSYSFAGSDALAAQIELGARPDVFASANTQLPAELFKRGLLERPVNFASNRLVLAVPDGSHVRAFAEIARPGVTLAVGTRSVPVGAYTLQTLARLPLAQRRVLTGEIRDREPDALGIVAKVAEGAVDGGFVYQTDVTADRGRVRAVALPASAQPDIEYAVAVVRGSSERARARAFIAGLLDGPGYEDLRRAGFLPPRARQSARSLR